jgi:hypothetical protein
LDVGVNVVVALIASPVEGLLPFLCVVPNLGVTLLLIDVKFVLWELVIGHIIFRFFQRWLWQRTLCALLFFL